MTAAMAPACGTDGSPEATTTATTTTVAPAPTTTSTTSTTVAVRTVALGETFSISVGQSVTVAGEGLSLTYTEVVADSRCRPGQQCITAGEASIAVTASKVGMAPATLKLGDGPAPPRYAGYRIDFIQLNFARPPVARLKVTRA